MSSPAPSPATPNNPRNPYASPKSRFLQNPANITNHHALVDSEAFNRAVDTALLEQAAKNAWDVNTADPQHRNTAAIEAGYKNAGAQEFVMLLKGLSEVPKPRPPSMLKDSLPDETLNRRQ